MAKFLGRGKVARGARLEWPVHLRDATVQNDVHIGRYTYLRQNTYASNGARIGRFCSIARNVEIGPLEHPIEWMSTHSFQYDHLFFDNAEGYRDHARIPQPELGNTVIGNDVWIAAQTVIRRGMRIGNGAIIGANSFVNADVPAYAVVAGTPARVLRYRFPPAIIARLEDLKWWEFLPSQMDGIQFDQIELALEQLTRLRAEQSNQ